METVRIPALPPDLAEVPVWSEGCAAWRPAWRAWSRAMAAYRVRVLDAARANPKLWQVEARLCAEDPAYFIAMWLWIEEPRPRKGEDMVKPFTPFGYQILLTREIAAAIAEPEQADVFISKARGLGATWIVTAVVLWGWLYRTWRLKLVSRKEELVDRPLDVDSMFGRIDFMLEHLPREMLPPGLVLEGTAGKRHRNHNMLKHPARGNPSQITGESTTGKTARGARATAIVYDEAAFIKDWNQVFSTGGGTTDHRIAISSESIEEGEDWEETWQAARDEIANDPDCKHKLFELDYHHNPYFDEEWREREEARLKAAGDPHGFAREYLRQPRAGMTTYIYPGVDACPDDKALEYDPGLVLLASIDPGMADDTAIVFAQLAGGLLDRQLRWLDSYQRNQVPAEFYAHLLTGIPPEPGDVCWPLRKHFEGRRERDLMAWLRDVPPWGMRVFMDPAGDQTDMSGLSFLDRLVRTSRGLRQRRYERLLAEHGPEWMERNAVPAPKSIKPLFEDLYKKNRHDVRHLALNEFLGFMVFGPKEGAQQIRYHLRNYKYSDPGGKSTSQPGVLHNEHSHVATACEYLCVYARMGKARPPKRRDAGDERRAA